jgi:hypothetical protein
MAEKRGERGPPFALVAAATSIASGAFEQPGDVRATAKPASGAATASAKLKLRRCRNVRRAAGQLVITSARSAPGKRSS